jgi:hypothetical protein
MIPKTMMQAFIATLIALAITPPLARMIGIGRRAA